MSRAIACALILGIGVPVLFLASGSVMFAIAKPIMERSEAGGLAAGFACAVATLAIIGFFAGLSSSAP